MADSIEQRIINAIVVRMKTILTANGYVTGIGARVEDSRSRWDQNELPAVSVFDGPVEPADGHDNAIMQIRLMPVAIRVFFETGDTATVDAALARNVIKDIYRAINGATDERSAQMLARQWPTTPGTLPPLAMQTREKGHVVGRDPESYEITGCQVQIEVQYQSKKFNLESQQ